jgi:hypothetical protein
MEDLSIVANGQLRPQVFQPRPYPQKTAGQPIKFKREGNGLTYQWAHEPSLGKTELYVPPGYTEGKGLIVSPSSLRCSVEGITLSCEGDARGPATVTVSAPG